MPRLPVDGTRYGQTLQEQELDRYRGLISPPEVFADGFNWRTVISAVFLGFIMMPGAMYLSLVVGNVGSIATASQWVTIILFAEIARRSLKDLKMQEYISCTSWRGWQSAHLSRIALEPVPGAVGLRPRYGDRPRNSSLGGAAGGSDH